jgi:hypothetical protein
MAVSRRLGAALVIVPAATWALVSACTFGNLAGYAIETCPSPLGMTTTVQAAGSLTGMIVTFTNAGDTAIAAYPSSPNNTCIIGVGETTTTTGFLAPGCSLFPLPAGSSVYQPSIVPLSSGYASAFISKGACPNGSLGYAFSGAGSMGTLVDACPASGAALPSVTPLGDGTTALVTYYQVPLGSRSDPASDCSMALPAPLVAALINGATTSSPTFAPLGSPDGGLGEAGAGPSVAPITLAGDGISIRPAALLSVPGQPQALVAAPHGGSVALWTVDSKLTVTDPIPVPLMGATAVSMAAGADGSGQVAIVGELGCAPQAIGLAIGSQTGGFTATTVVAAGSAAAIQPSVAWVARDQDWVVSWISFEGGPPQAMARRFQADGTPLGDAISSGGATGTVVTTGGHLFSYAGDTAFQDTSLGCL